MVVMKKRCTWPASSSTAVNTDTGEPKLLFSDTTSGMLDKISSGGSFVSLTIIVKF